MADALMLIPIILVMFAIHFASSGHDPDVPA